MGEYAFTKINIEPILGKSAKDKIFPLQSSIGFSDGEEAGEIFIHLGIRKGAASPEDFGSYAFEVNAIGRFSADRKLLDTDHARAMSIVKVNGASILLGAIRELVLQLTSRGIFKAYTIPAMSFIDLLEREK